MTRRTRRRGGWVGWLALLAVAGCAADPNTARGTADLFVDAHYVLIDLPRSLGYATGVARSKIEQEMELLKGVADAERGDKPTVHYRFLEEHDAGEGASNFLYLGDIAAAGERFERKFLVTVRREDTSWRVTNFQDMNP